MLYATRFVSSLCFALVAACASAGDSQAPTGQPTVAPIPMMTVAPSPTIEAPAPTIKTPEPTLDLAALKLRLRETRAIGVFAKLALRNQLDDLLQQLRSHHLGAQKSNIANLRQAYESLVFKVLVQVGNGDPPLALTLSTSREAIWIILADPELFEAAS